MILDGMGKFVNNCLSPVIAKPPRFCTGQPKNGTAVERFSQRQDCSYERPNYALYVYTSMCVIRNLLTLRKN